MKQLIRFAEIVGGALLLVVLVLITASAISRYGFNRPLLDGDDIARLLLLPAIFFGLAGTCHRGEHIQVDLVWEQLRPAGRLAMDRLATFLMVVIVGAMAVASVPRVIDIYNSHQGTYEMRLPMWPFFAAASLGLILSGLVLVRRLFTLHQEGSAAALHEQALAEATCRERAP